MQQQRRQVASGGIRVPCLEQPALVLDTRSPLFPFTARGRKMVLRLLLLALALGAARAQLPPLPASCVGTVSSFTALLGAQTEIDAACPKGATTCSSTCKAALAKVRRRAGGGGAGETSGRFAAARLEYLPC